VPWNQPSMARSSIPMDTPMDPPSWPPTAMATDA